MCDTASSGRKLEAFPADSRTGSREGVEQGGQHDVPRHHRHAQAELQVLLAGARVDRRPHERVVERRELRHHQPRVHRRPDHLRSADRRRHGRQSLRRLLRAAVRDGAPTPTATASTTSIPGGCISCTLEFDVTNFGRAQGAPALKDYKWISMGDGNTFGDFTAFRDHPWKMHLEQRSDGDGTGMKLIWRNGASSRRREPRRSHAAQRLHDRLAAGRRLSVHLALDARVTSPSRSARSTPTARSAAAGSGFRKASARSRTRRPTIASRSAPARAARRCAAPSGATSS